MLSRRRFLHGALAAPAMIAGAPAVFADEYPTGPIRGICPFPPGSGADMRVRFYGNKLAGRCGQPFVTENRPGAMGNIATETVARAKPDGYTIYIAPGSSTLAAAPSLFKKLGYDPIKDFEHITTLSRSAFAFCVAADSQFKTIADLTAHLKQRGDGASYGSIAPPGFVASEIYRNAFGLSTVVVHYKEQGGLFNDLFSGHTVFICIDLTTSRGLLQSGRMRALSMTCANRLATAPDIPGAKESGIPNLDVITWWSVHTPAKTPRAVCDKLETWFNAIAVEPDVVKFNADLGSDVMPGNSDSLKELLVRQTREWAEWARMANIEPQ
jgi:tripartite-type tricarboxylate transporter receptor subunit TctC